MWWAQPQEEWKSPWRHCGDRPGCPSYRRSIRVAEGLLFQRSFRPTKTPWCPTCRGPAPGLLQPGLRPGLESLQPLLTLRRKVGEASRAVLQGRGLCTERVSGSCESRRTKEVPGTEGCGALRHLPGEVASQKCALPAWENLRHQVLAFVIQWPIAWSVCVCLSGSA